MPATQARILAEAPASTIEWLLEPENPAVAVLTRRTLLGESRDDDETAALWERRNEYAPVAAILGAQLEDGSWAPPASDYRKYTGSLWQVHILGELWANGDDPRVRRAAEYAFSRQLSDGSWSTTDMRPSGSIACLTSNVARALARMGWARDERVVAALRSVVNLFDELGAVNCRFAQGYQLNGYCHMLAVKELLFLAEMPPDLWPDGAPRLRDACVAHLREREILRYVPAEAREFNAGRTAMRAGDHNAYRERFLAEHPGLHFEEKPGWKRLGYPLSYNSDALEALWAVAQAGEPPRAEYGPAVELVRQAADANMRWPLKNSLNGKMLADVEAKGRPSKWLTLRALQVLEWAQG